MGRGKLRGEGPAEFVNDSFVSLLEALTKCRTDVVL